jgi:hypothetical protein
MEEFLIELAKKANWERFLPFPDAYRRTTRPGEPHTKAEYERLFADLQDLERHPELKAEITKTHLKMTIHGQNSVHPSITELEFKYPYVDSFINDKKYKKRWYLFHGSSKSNWYSILHNGLRNMSGSSLMTNGAVYGNGIYLTNNLSMAYGYGVSTEYPSLTIGDTEEKIQIPDHCVAVVELLVDPAPYKKAQDIYVVPDASLLFPRYMYIMKHSPMADAVPVLEYYKKLRDASLVDKTKPKRVLNEIETLKAKSLLIEVTSDNVYILFVNGHLIRMYLQNFPYQPPIFQLAYKLGRSSDNFDDKGIYKYQFNEWAPINTVLALIDKLFPMLDGFVGTTQEYPIL